MKTPKDVLNKVKTRGDFRRVSESGKRQNANTAKEVSKIWKMWGALAEAYGNAFVNQFGEEPSATWLNGLNGYTEEELKRGFDAALDSGSDFAPNLGTIRRLIGETQTKAYHRPYDPDKAIQDHGEGRLLPGPQDSRTTDQIRSDLLDMFKGKGNE